MNIKEDPRALRTQEMLKEAVFTLLVQGIEINQLTVQKVTNQAKLNRTTFYLHYQDIHALISHLTNEILNELTAKIEPLIHSKDVNNKTRLLQLLDYLYSQR